MMNLTRHYATYLAGILLLLGASCRDAFDDGDTLARRSDIICFGLPDEVTTRSLTATADSQLTVLPLVGDARAESLYLTCSVGDFPTATTRATMLQGDYAPSSFRVLSLMQKGTESPIVYFQQTYALDNTSTAYVGTTNYYWPGSDWTMNFYAVDAASVADLTTDATFSYTVPADISEQQDILVATSSGVSGNYNQALPLTFTHTLAAVRFTISSLPTGYKVSSVKLSGLQYVGTYDCTTSSWSVSGGTTNYELSNPQGFSAAAGEELTSESNCFMFLPQTLGSSATVEIVVSKDNSEMYYTGTLSGTTWQGGKVYTYSINAYTYSFDLDYDNVTTVDAHYIIKTVVMPKKATTHLNDNDTWSIEASYNTTLLNVSDANFFIRKGYWTDKYQDANGNETGESARGESTLSGTIGAMPDTLFVMIPENTGTTSRPIELKVTIRDHVFKTDTITQLAAVDGWEQMDESEAVEFGFMWDRKANYIYPYNYGNIWGITISGSKYLAYCQSVITDNQADDYADVISYSVGLFQYRYYISIDYSKLNNLTQNGYGNSDSGCDNTVQLKNIAGTSLGMTFEDVILSIMKTESGKENEHAFRLPNSSETKYVAAPSGSNSNSSAAVGTCLLKNRYNLKKSESEDNEAGYTPVISDSDVVWYLPAVNEFEEVPTVIQDVIVPANCWSSNIDNSDNTVAKNGAGSSVSRTELLHVRAKRK